MTNPVPTSPSAPSPDSHPGGFQQRLGLFDATMLVVGAMIGSGIFVVSADIALEVGSSGWLMLVWVLTGVMTVIGALSYAELAAMMPRAGGQYVYLRESYSPLWGFLYGWTLFLVIQTGSIAAVSVAFAKFLGVLVPELGPAHILWSIGAFQISSGQLVAVVLTASLTWLNTRGVEGGKWVQNVFTVAKMLGLSMLVLLGLTVAANSEVIAANWSNIWDGIFKTEQFAGVQKLADTSNWLTALMVVGASMVGSLFSADAWNNVTFTAGETKNPSRNLPLSMAIGTVLVIGLYLLCNVAYLAALPIQGLADGATALERGIAHAREGRVGTAVLEQASPLLGVSLMAITIMISTFGCVNGLILMGARLYYAMARDGLFFKSCGELNSRGVPAIGLWMQGLWSIALVFSGTFNALLDYVIFAALLFYALTVAGLFVLRRTQPNAERPYRTWGYPVVPALYIFMCLAVMLDLLIVKPLYTWPGLLIVASGVPVYFVWRSLGQKAAD